MVKEKRISYKIIEAVIREERRGVFIREEKRLYEKREAEW